MSSKDVIISARGLGKSYRLAQAGQHSTFAEAVIHRLRRPFHRQTTESFWALQDVSFDVKQGEVVGLVGRNGAGKSTLLKILSRITEPTTGEAQIHGRIGSLIEVGTGFQEELTGRENIYLNGSILGMRRREIAQRFDEIVDFSGVERFLDIPVKRYSSGMYVRLAFAVAAHLTTDILIVDEVLAVGDVEFQKKCLGKLGSVASSGRTVIFVSHNMATLEALCDRGLLFDGGRIVKSGTLKEVATEYHRLVRPGIDDGSPAEGPVSYGAAHQYFRSADMVDETGHSTRCIPVGGMLRLKIAVETDEPIEYPTFVVKLDGVINGYRMLTVKSPLNEGAIPRFAGRCEIACAIPNLPLAPGDYAIHIAVAKSGVVLEMIDSQIRFTIRNADTFEDGWGAQFGLCVAQSEWSLAETAREVA